MTASKKGYIGMGMEGRVANWYARSMRKDMAQYTELARRKARETAESSAVLEVASGPGYLAIEFAKCGAFQVTGLDISKTFVEMAQENARAEGVRVDFQLGNASAMPFADRSFDLILCRAAFKNFSQPVEAIDEMHRVLKPGGRAFIMDLRKDASVEEIDEYVEKLGVGWFGGLMMKLTFRFMLIPRAYTREQFRGMAAKSKFGGCEIDAGAIGFEITLRKPAS